MDAHTHYFQLSFNSPALHGKTPYSIFCCIQCNKLLGHVYIGEFLNLKLYTVFLQKKEESDG